MPSLNRDTWIALFLLVFCAVFFWASGDIRSADFGTLAPSTWPRIILGFLAGLSFLFFLQSLRRGSGAEGDGLQSAGTSPEDGEAPEMSFFQRHANPIFCFVLYFSFLLTLPFFGLLLGGILFVFLTLTVLGGHKPRQLLLHGVIAVLSIGGMWSFFTFALDVLLPTGSLFEVI